MKAFLITSIWIAQLVWLDGCTASVKLPEPVQEDYNEQLIFLITEIDNHTPASGHSIRRKLYADGTITNYSYDFLGGYKGAPPGQLPTEQWGEVQAILEAMTTISSHDPFSGQKVITLSFLWHGENHIVSFSEKSCPDGLDRLFDVTNTAWTTGEPFPNPCRNESLSNFTVIETPCCPLDALPDSIRYKHSARLFQLNWFKQPFTDSYEQLYFVIDADIENVVAYWKPTFENTPSFGEATANGKQEIQTILASLVAAEPTERPMGNTLITLGFSWEADYRILVFGNANCPDDLRRLFEIADEPFSREAPDNDLFQIPCQEEIR